MPILRQKINTVFEHNGVPSFSQFYNLGIYAWKLIFKGMVPDWATVSAPTIKNPYNKRKRNKMNYAKALCSELANLTWAEGSSVSVSQKGWNSTDPDPLNEFIKKVLKDNDFDTKMRQLIEESFGYGGGTIRTYVVGEPNDDGYMESGTEKIVLQYGRADQFVPISWDNKRILEAVFIEKKAVNGWYYTRLEFHKWNGTEYVISNEVYKTQKAPLGNTSQDILGIRSPIAEVWGNLAESVSFEDLSLGLFSYFRPCMANNLDDNSPLGISVYANCIDTLKALDIAFDSLIQEIVLGKKRIIVPATAVRTVRDQHGFEQRYFDASDEVYEALDCDNPDDLKIRDNTVELRIDEHIKAINALLNILSTQIGLSEGALSFDMAKGMKTATEVISENSKTYRTIKLMQEPIRASIEDTIHAIIDMACAYDVKFKFEGKEHNIYDLVKGGYEISVTFDDSIIQDRPTLIAQGVSLVQSNLLSRKTFLMNYMGYTSEDADAELERLRNEASMQAQARVLDIDWSNIGG